MFCLNGVGGGGGGGVCVCGGGGGGGGLSEARSLDFSNQPHTSFGTVSDIPRMK